VEEVLDEALLEVVVLDREALALVLGDRAEDSFRQAMLVSQGDVSVFFSNALVGTITGAALLLLFWPLISMLIDLARGRDSAPAGKE